MAEEDEIVPYSQHLRPRTHRMTTRASVPSPGFSAAFAERARPVLDLIDDLRKIGIQKCIPIPQIAVMGDQGSGKSSVLEAISGIAFPRGTGLVTRCPTQVTMTHGTTWSATVRAGSGELHRLEAGEEALIPELIKEFTIQLAGERFEGGFSSPDEQIEISLISPDVPDLTIIDLPGIVRTTTRGQSEEVKNQVDAMLDRFLQQERTIVLAVIPANVDIATVDILERASKVDPEGKRTIGVLTKPDLVDKGAESEVIDVLANRTKPLLHGYFMVKNRSQEELDDECDIGDVARQRERAWLQTSKYANVAGVGNTRLGVRALTSALTELLVERIVEVIPQLTAEVDQVLKDTAKELESLGKPPPDTPEACRALAGETIRNLCRALRSTTSESRPINGNFAGESPGVLQMEVKLRKDFVRAIRETNPGFGREKDTCAIRVTEIVRNGERQPGVPRFRIGDIDKDVAWRRGDRVGTILSFNYQSSGYTKGKVISVACNFKDDLVKCMEQRRGRELPGFMSFSLFSDMIAEYVERWANPTEIFHVSVCEALKTATFKLLTTIACDWPRLQKKMERVLESHFDSEAAETSTKLRKLLDLEKFPSTENRYLWDTINKFRDERMAKKLKAQAHVGSSGTQVISVETVCAILKSDIGNYSSGSPEVQDMIDMLKAYWQLAVKRYVDSVAMLVTDAYTGPRHIDEIEKRLSHSLVLSVDESAITSLFIQNHARKRRREELINTDKAMRSARKRLREGIY